MGLKNIEGFGTFGKMNRQNVTGFFKAAGTRDPDILYMKKQVLIRPNKNMMIGAWGFIVLGAVCAFTVILAIIGIPLILLGVWLIYFCKKNIKVVDAVYSEFVPTGGD